MGRLCVVMILAASFAALSPCSAQVEWLLSLNCYPDTTFIGVSPAASDNYDVEDQPYGPFANLVMNLRIYHSAADGWLGPEGFYQGDIRAPMVEEKTWGNIFLWWGDPDRLHFNSWLSFYPLSPARPTYRFTLYLDQVPAGVRYDGPWQWELSPTSRTAIPEGTFTPFASETGLDSYRFHLTVVVPEPMGLLVLAGGLALVGVKRRRR